MNTHTDTHAYGEFWTRDPNVREGVPSSCLGLLSSCDQQHCLKVAHNVEHNVEHNTNTCYQNIDSFSLNTIHRSNTDTFRNRKRKENITTQKLCCIRTIFLLPVVYFFISPPLSFFIPSIIRFLLQIFQKYNGRPGAPISWWGVTNDILHSSISTSQHNSAVWIQAADERSTLLILNVFLPVVTMWRR